MKKYIVDRIEGDFAVLESEDGKTENVNISNINGCSEGDVIIFENGNYRIDTKLSEDRKILIAEKMKKLFGEKH